LLALYEKTFGVRVDCFTQCPQCPEKLQFALAIKDIQVSSEQKEKSEVGELISGEFRLRFRLPNSVDLAEITNCREVEAARHLLVQRCVLEATCNEAPISISDLPAEIITHLAERMGKCDPQAEVIFHFQCPTCQHRWQALFDIVTFFWTKLATQAKRLLQEVHILAQFYHWREADILAMSTWRRHCYLEMIGK
jgi:hypothetical protein